MSSSRIRPGNRKPLRLPRKANTWLGSCKGPAGRIIQHTRFLQNLQEQLAKNLPEPLISHVQVISLHDGRLALAADSAVWANQLRHRRSAILRHMSDMTRQPLQQLEIKISPLFAPPLVRTIQRRLPEHAGQNIELTARNISDSELSAALRRLAQHARVKPGKG